MKRKPVKTARTTTGGKNVSSHNGVSKTRGKSCRCKDAAKCECSKKRY